MASLGEEENMSFSNLLRTGVLILVAVVVAGCATPPSPFPRDPNARRHYDAGDRLLDAQRFESAAAEYEMSLQIESIAYIAHTKLAVAYIGQRKFAEAARQFEETYRLWGGPRGGPGWAIMQALALQRSGKNDEAEKLLRHWTGPGIVVTGTGAYTAGEPLQGFSNLLARYLLGSIDESSVLGAATSDQKSYAYLVIGISSAAKGDKPKARKFLQLAADTMDHRGGWRFALVRAEMLNLQK
jgi:tetratricopeptide (TPR) repeat protein